MKFNRKLHPKKTDKIKVKPKETQVVKLQKQINKLTKKMDKGYETFYQYTAQSFPAQMVADYYGFNLCNYAGLAPCYGTLAADYNNCNKWRSRHFDIEYTIDCNTEQENITMTVYIVTLKADATSLYNKTTGVLTLAAPTNYVTNSSAHAQLNPKDFTIHYKKRIVIGNNGVVITGGGAVIPPSGAGDGGVKNWYRDWVRIKTNHDVVNPDGNVVLMACNQDATKQYYFLVFNDNSSIDSEYPRLRITQVNKIDVAN